MEITITVNERKHVLEVDPEEKLLFILRDRLQLTGTKNGCNQGYCSACTVIMDNKVVKSCRIKAKRLNGSKILTIEGISPKSLNEELHPIQKAFIDATAVQCGFCTPGIIMKLYSLYNNNPNSTEEDVLKALERHLCRCTGYKPILDAAILARRYLTERNMI